MNTRRAQLSGILLLGDLVLMNVRGVLQHTQKLITVN